MKQTKPKLKKLEHVLSLCEETLEEDIRKLDYKERIKLWFNLQAYVRPRLIKTEYSSQKPAETPEDKKPGNTLGTLQVVVAESKDNTRVIRQSTWQPEINLEN